jgi:hypothetical protein
MADKPKNKNDRNGKNNWVSLVQERIEDGTNWGSLVQMFTSASYFIGNQWIYWSRADRKIREAPNTDNQQRITYNKIRPRVMTLLSKLTKSKIKFDVMPENTTQERAEIAKAAKKFLDFLWTEMDMDHKTKEVHLYDLIYGWCAAKVYFDPDTGEDITPDEDEEGYEEGMKPVYTGEIKCRICDPLTIFIDPSATSEEDVRWIIERKPRDVDYVKETYDKDVLPDENVDYLSQFDINNMVYNNTLGVGTNQSKRRKNMVMVDEMWIYPCKKYPKGVKVTVAGDQLLDLDEKAGQPPYVIFKFLPILSRVQGEGLIKDMIPIQKEINIMRTMFATHAKRMGNSIWLVPLGSGVDEEELSNEEGAIIHYNATTGQEPHRAEAPNIPNFYDRYTEFLMDDIDDMSAAREISQGRLPQGLDTASGLAMMIEQENEKLTVAAHNYERGMKKLLTRVLELVKKHYTEERQGRILGEDNEIELISFTGADLTGGEDINIVEGSSLPESKAAQEQRIMNLWQAGAIVTKDGQPDPNTLLQLLGMGDSSELFEQELLDQNKAKMENKFFEEIMKDPQLAEKTLMYYQMQQLKQEITQQFGGQLPPEELQAIPQLQQIQQMQPPKGYPTVRDFQDHDVHIYQHNNFRKSSDYDELPPEIKQIMDDHVQQHIQFIQQNQQSASKPPSASINYKDLTPEGKAQLAQQAGIQLDPQSIQQQEQQQMESKQPQDNGQKFQEQVALKQLDHQNTMTKEQAIAQREMASQILQGRMDMVNQAMQHQQDQQKIVLQGQVNQLNKPDESGSDQ